MRKPCDLAGFSRVHSGKILVVTESKYGLFLNSTLHFYMRSSQIKTRLKTRPRMTYPFSELQLCIGLLGTSTNTHIDFPAFT